MSKFHFKLCGIIFLLSQAALGGGSAESARITNVEFNNAGDFVFSFDWIKDSGFQSEVSNRRMVFEYLNWPANSDSWILRLLPWSEKIEARYPVAALSACKNLIIDAYRTGATIKMGQMGTVEFKPSSNSPNTFVVPFAEVGEVRGFPEQKACYLYASRI